MTKTNGTDVSEATETDRCMGDQPKEEVEDNNHKTDANWFVRFRSRVCKKWQLSHKVFYAGVALVSVIFLLFIVVISLGAAWPHIPHSQRFPICSQPACLRASAQIRESMNSSATPCTGLWNWSCGSWLAKNAKTQKNLNQKQQLLKEGTVPIRDVIANLNSSLLSASVEWKLKYLYENCLDVKNVESDGSKPLTTIINLLGGWYITRNWDIDDFNGKALLTTLHFNYSVRPFFDITVEPDPYTPGKNIIRISPAGLGLPDREYYYREQDDRVQNAYKELLREVVQYLGATRHEAEKFGNDIFHYEKRIADIMPSVENLQNPMKSSNIITISELEATMPTIPFYDILTAMFAKAKIGENTEVAVTSLEYLLQISQIIASTDRRTMNGYLIWTLVRQYLPYLSAQFTLALDNFQTELFGTTRTRPEMCSNLVEDYMGLAIEVMRDKISPVEKNAFRVVNDTFHTTLNVARKSLAQFKSMPQLYKHLKMKLSSLRLQIGAPENVHEHTFLKEYYLKLIVIKLSFFASVTNGIDFKRELAQKMLTQWTLEDSILRDLSRDKVVYSPSNNLIIVPKSLLRSPYFESDQPKSVIYGRLGVEIANAIVSALLPYSSFWTADKKLLSPYHQTVNNSLESISGQRKCLFNYIANANSGLEYNFANETALVTLRELYAVSIANEALLSDLSEEQHIHQPGLQEYEDTSLFFLTYAQTQCSASTNQFETYESLVKFKLPRKFYLYVAWAQLPQFSDSLQCNTDHKSQCIDISL